METLNGTTSSSWISEPCDPPYPFIPCMNMLVMYSNPVVSFSINIVMRFVVLDLHASSRSSLVHWRHC